MQNNWLPNIVGMPKTVYGLIVTIVLGFMFLLIFSLPEYSSITIPLTIVVSVVLLILMVKKGMES